MRHISLVTIIITLSICSISAEDKLIYVDGGTFHMGLEKGVDNPKHEVIIDDFYISKYELTVGEWKQYIYDSGIDFDLLNNERMLMEINKGNGYIIPDDHPMYFITWEEATEYCNWLSLKSGLTPVYSYEVDINDKLIVSMDVNANGYRLPTEAEWEFAAKGGILTKGYKYSGSNNLDEVSWNRTNSDRVLHLVGLKRPNELGLYDMNGNVAEYTWDYYDDRYYNDSIRKNPTGPNKAFSPEVFKELEEYYGIDSSLLYNLRTLRGGSIISSKAKYNLNEKRYVTFQNDRGFKGLRLVRNGM